MGNTGLIRLPSEYIYLDGPGIESLHAQIIETVETSRTTTTQWCGAPRPSSHVRPIVPRVRRRTGADSVLARARQRADYGALLGMQTTAWECHQPFHRDRARTIPPRLMLADLICATSARP